MKYWLKEFVKSHHWIYVLYFYIGSFIVNVIKLFVKPDEKLILFVSYGGKRFSDSPKMIFEKMQTDERFTGYRFVWGFVNPDNYIIEGAEKVKIDTPKYYLAALKSRVWVTNVIIERALSFTGKHTFYLCTSHGIPLKKVNVEGNSFKGLGRCLYDCSLAQSEFDRNLQSVEFGIPVERIKMLGYPRNDTFSTIHSDILKKVRDFYGISNVKHIILYAPTYRDWNNGIEKISFDIDKWESVLGDRYVLFFRAHPTVNLSFNNYHGEFFINTTSYENLDELLIAADILISDYSSMFFDYSIMHKPMICWAYDYDIFKQYRDLQVNVVEELYGGEIEEDAVLEYINKGDFHEALKKTILFQKKYVTVYGNATTNALNLIYEKINQ